MLYILCLSRVVLHLMYLLLSNVNHKFGLFEYGVFYFHKQGCDDRVIPEKKIPPSLLCAFLMERCADRSLGNFRGFEVENCLNADEPLADRWA